MNGVVQTITNTENNDSLTSYILEGNYFFNYHIEPTKPKVDKNGIYYDTSDEEDDSSEEEEDLTEDLEREDMYKKNFKTVKEIVLKYKDYTDLIMYIILLEINDEKYIKFGCTTKFEKHLTNLLSKLRGEYDKVIFKDVIGLFQINDRTKKKLPFMRSEFENLGLRGEKHCLKSRFSSYYQNYMKNSIHNLYFLRQLDHKFNMKLFDKMGYFTKYNINSDFMKSMRYYEKYAVQ